MDLQLPMQSVTITTKLWVQILLMGGILDTTLKIVSDLRQVSGFPPGTLFSPTNKTIRHDITEILLKVALKTIIHSLISIFELNQV